MSNRKQIVLHGYLADLVDGPLEFFADTVVEAINALCRAYPAFQPELGKPRHRIRVLGFDDPRTWDVRTDREVLHVFPDFSGMKNFGFVKIILGVALIGAAVLFPGFSHVLLPLGIGLVLGGILEFISPAPKTDTGDDSNNSKYLPAPGLTTQAGTPIPIGYGRTKVVGHLLSVNVTAKDVAVDEDPDENPLTQVFEE